MATKPIVSKHKCAACVKPLPVYERGVHTTSPYLGDVDGLWFYPDCKHKTIIPEGERK